MVVIVDEENDVVWGPFESKEAANAWAKKWDWGTSDGKGGYWGTGWHIAELLDPKEMS